MTSAASRPTQPEADTPNRGATLRWYQNALELAERAADELREENARLRAEIAELRAIIAVAARPEPRT